MSKILTGVCAIIANPDGSVVETYADFDRSGFGGHTLEESQRIRARTIVRGRFAASHLNGWMGKGMDSYFVDQFWQNAERAGYKLQIIGVSNEADPT